MTDRRLFVMEDARRRVVTNLIRIPGKPDPTFSAYQTNRAIPKPVLLLSENVLFHADENSLVEGHLAQAVGNIYVTATDAYLVLIQMSVNLSTGEMLHDLPEGAAMGFSRWSMLFDDGNEMRVVFDKQ